MRTLFLVTILSGCGSEPEPEPADSTPEAPLRLDGTWEGTCSSDAVDPMSFEWTLEAADGQISGSGTVREPDVPEHVVEIELSGIVYDNGEIALDLELVAPEGSIFEGYDWPAIWTGTLDDEVLDGLLVMGPLEPYELQLDVDCALTRVSARR